jgi:hypothetical protein
MTCVFATASGGVWVMVHILQEKEWVNMISDASMECMTSHKLRF